MKKIFHILEAQQFNRKFLDDLCTLTTKIRVIHRTSREGALWLKSFFLHKRAMLYFTQPSTRTYLSFLSACQNLGLDVLNVRDPAISSEVKGESPLDAVRTFASYADIIIMRSIIAGLARESSVLLDSTRRPVPIINAGSGSDEHPTQALLDIYTLVRSFEKQGGIDGKVIALVGDLKRGRTVRSLAYLMKYYTDVKLLLVSPPEFKMKDDILTFLRKYNIVFDETEDFDGAVADADGIYMTRIQDEHDKSKGDSRKVDISKFSFLPRHLDILKKTGVVMHPLPRRSELDSACDVDSRVKIWRQERNGMWTRTALLYLILSGGSFEGLPLMRE